MRSTLRLAQEATNPAHRLANPVLVLYEGEANVSATLERILGAGAQVVELTPRRETLEDLFIKRAL